METFSVNDFEVHSPDNNAFTSGSQILVRSRITLKDLLKHRFLTLYVLGGVLILAFLTYLPSDTDLAVQNLTFKTTALLPLFPFDTSCLHSTRSALIVPLSINFKWGNTFFSNYEIHYLKKTTLYLSPHHLPTTA